MLLRTTGQAAQVQRVGAWFVDPALHEQGGASSPGTDTRWLQNSWRGTRLETLILERVVELGVRLGERAETAPSVRVPQTGVSETAFIGQDEVGGSAGYNPPPVSHGSAS
jgi:hypothetical protein